jgi:hypothetical protein
MTALRQLAGAKFGRLTVISRVEGARGKPRWHCVCSCGNPFEAQGGNLTSGRALSCGCLRREKLRALRTTHGETGTRLYGQWQGMLARCLRPNHPRARDYSLRGITVCPEWLVYEKFRDDMTAAHGPCPDGWSLDRIDNDGSYTPANCRWAPPAVQNRNRRKHSLHTATSKHQGVCWNAERRKWIASVVHNGRRFYLGGFVNEADAASAARAFREAHGHGVYEPKAPLLAGVA